MLHAQRTPGGRCPIKVNIRLSLTLSALLLGCAAAVPAQSLPSEFESWNEIQLIVPLIRDKNSKGKMVDKVTATFSGISRIGRNPVRPLDSRVSATIDYRVNKYLSLMAAVLYRRDELTPRVDRYETRLDLGFVLTKTWGNFTFRDRNVIEHRFRNSRKDINVYRNRGQISYSIKHKNKELFAPFVANEGYYDLTNKLWSQNEFHAGISRRLNKRTVLDVAYTRNDSRPFNANALNLTLKIKLR